MKKKSSNKLYFGEVIENTIPIKIQKEWGEVYHAAAYLAANLGEQSSSERQRAWLRRKFSFVSIHHTTTKGLGFTPVATPAVITPS